MLQQIKQHLYGILQDDYINHNASIKPQPIRPVENTERPTDPLIDRTEYKLHYTPKPPQKGK